MGAGAGYTIEGRDISLVDNVHISNIAYDNAIGELVVDCDVLCKGAIKAESYYYGCDWIDDVPMHISNIKLDVEYESWGIFSNEFIATIESMFDDNIQNIDYLEYKNMITIDSFDTNEISGLLGRYLDDFRFSVSYGGGWSHATFSGEFTVDDASFGTDGYYETGIMAFDVTIGPSMVIDFIDLAVQGENRDYTVYYNWEPLDGFSSMADAIDYLKQTIQEQIDAGSVDDIDFVNCYVSEDFWTQDVQGNIDYLDGFDNTVYQASNDPDYQAYL